MNSWTFLFALIPFFISLPAYSQPRPTGTLVCGRCGHVEQSRPAMLAHTCSKHGLNCASTAPYIPPAPVKTIQQIKEEAEKKDLREAAEEANDLGVECYEKKDWATAINYFKASLEYVPGFEDAVYNLRKAEEKLKVEIKQKEEETKRKQAAEEEIQTVKLPDPLQKFMDEADKIIVPPPSWESNIHEQVEQIRLGQNGESDLILANNVLVAAFDQVTTTEGLDLRLKLLLIGAKSTNAAQDEADIVVFKQTAWYERTLQVLKDKKQASLLIAAIKALRENKPMPAGISPELVKMAKATQDPSLGNSSVHMAMSAMLSPESRAAFFQTFKMEAIGMISDKIKNEFWGAIEERVPVLKQVNEKISTGKELMDNIAKGKELMSKEDGSLFNSIIQNKINELEKTIQSSQPVPDPVNKVLSFFSSARNEN